MIHDVAVITQYVGNDYCDEIIRGITSFFSDKPVRLNVLETRTPDASASDFDYQYWSSFSLVSSKSIEAVIIISGTFCAALKPEDIKKIMEPYFHCPVISVSIEMPFSNSYSTKSDCSGGIKDLINHISSVHGKKKFGMITAGLTNSKEGIERFEAFKNALQEFNLPFDEDCIFDSDFSQYHTFSILKEKLKSRDDVKFDALFCANDFSAFGAVSALQELGFKIPEEIIIAGYDDCSIAASEVVPLTTINQNVFQQGYEAAKISYELICGNKPEKIKMVPVQPVFRESCGCKSKCLYNQSIIRNFHSQSKTYFDVANLNMHYYSLLDKLQSSHTLSEIYIFLNKILEEVNIKRFAICLYRNPVLVGRDEKFVLPETAIMAMAFDHNHRFGLFNSNIIFNHHDSIVPKGYLEDEESNFIITSIYYGEKQYGYMMYKPGERIPSFYSVYMKIVSNAIVRAYDYTKILENQIRLEQENKLLQQNNLELNTASRTDELTQVYNRRGFLYLAQQSINLSLELGNDGLVIFGDMDGLKYINDNFGHDSGDFAIRSLAEILTKVFRQNDIIGRLGGDEFAIVAVGMERSEIDKKISEIQKLCDEWKDSNNSPYQLSISLGAVEFSKKNYLIQDLLSIADEIQYIEKKSKKLSRE